MAVYFLKLGDNATSLDLNIFYVLNAILLLFGALSWIAVILSKNSKYYFDLKDFKSENYYSLILQNDMELNDKSVGRNNDSHKYNYDNNNNDKNYDNNNNKKNINDYKIMKIFANEDNIKKKKKNIYSNKSYKRNQMSPRYLHQSTEKSLEEAFLPKSDTFVEENNSFFLDDTGGNRSEENLNSRTDHANGSSRNGSNSNNNSDDNDNHSSDNKNDNDFNRHTNIDNNFDHDGINNNVKCDNYVTKSKFNSSYSSNKGNGDIINKSIQNGNSNINNSNNSNDNNNDNNNNSNNNNIINDNNNSSNNNNIDNDNDSFDNSQLKSNFLKERNTKLFITNDKKEFSQIHFLCIALFIIMFCSIFQASFFAFVTSSVEKRDIEQILYFDRLFADLLGRPLTRFSRPFFLKVFTLFHFFYSFFILFFLYSFLSCMG